MNQAIVVNSHSFVDVITNSSTELFVCDTDKSIKQVKEIIKNTIKHFSVSINDFNIRIYSKEELGQDRKDGDLWGYEKMKNVGKIIIEGTDDNIIPYSLFEMIEELFDAQRFHLG